MFQMYHNNTDFDIFRHQETQQRIYRPAYPYDFGVLCTFFAPIVHLYAQQ